MYAEEIPEPWAAWVYGPNRDKEVFASMADETKTNATPEAPGGPPPPAPEQTEQAVIPSMDGGPAPSGKVIDLSDVRAEAGKTGPETGEKKLGRGRTPKAKADKAPGKGRVFGFIPLFAIFVQ